MFAFLLFVISKTTFLEDLAFWKKDTMIPPLVKYSYASCIVIMGSKKYDVPGFMSWLAMFDVFKEKIQGSIPLFPVSQVTQLHSKKTTC